jgi:hypothetical protein
MWISLQGQCGVCIHANVVKVMDWEGRKEQ